MKYRHFQSIKDALAGPKRQKEVRKKAGLKNVSEKILMQMIHKKRPDLIFSMDYQILMEEHYWLNSKKHIIYPQNSDVLDVLLKAKFTLKETAGFDLPHKSFILALPKDFTINGHKPSGVLVSWETYRKREQTIIRQFWEDIEIKGIPIKEPEGRNIDERAISIAFHMKPDNDRPAYYRMTMPESMIPGILEGDEKVQDDLNRGFNRTTYIDYVSTENSEKKTQHDLFRIICALGIYTMHSDEVLVEGYPGRLAPQHFPPDARAANRSTLKMLAKRKGTSPTAHYRSWHFRQLLDEKYYRNEHAKKPRGSRVVFVRDTEVKQGSTTPETLLETA